MNGSGRPMGGLPARYFAHTLRLIIMGADFAAVAQNFIFLTRFFPGRIVGDGEGHEAQAGMTVATGGWGEIHPYSLDSTRAMAQ